MIKSICRGQLRATRTPVRHGRYLRHCRAVSFFARHLRRSPRITRDDHCRRRVGEVLAKHQKRVDGLEREIAELRERLEALERSGTKPKLVALASPGALIA